MEQNNFSFEIITPLNSFLNTETDSVIINTPTGKMGIQAFHEPSVISISKGEIKLKVKNKWISIIVSSGFMEVTNEKVIIFVDTAVWPDKMTEHQQQVKEEQLNEKKQRETSKEEHVKMQSFITKAINNIKIDKRT
jgi:F-type H+-transporting ATPase subunit epsilon